jgi:uroporphyrinogen-III synthase
MIGMIDPAWKDEVVERAAAAFETCQNAAASGFEELELNGSAGLLLNDDRACTNPATADEIADLDFNDVASPELTVDREIEHRAVSKPPPSIQPEPDGPDLLRLSGRGRAAHPTDVRHPG